VFVSAGVLGTLGRKLNLPIRGPSTQWGVEKTRRSRANWADHDMGLRSVRPVFGDPNPTQRAGNTPKMRERPENPNHQSESIGIDE
jgi:hypothetical protein